MSDPFAAAPATSKRSNRPASDVERDRWDRPLLPDIPKGDPYGETDFTTKSPYTSVSTLADVLCDFYGLNRWRMLKVAHGLAIREDLYNLACSYDPEDEYERKNLYRVVDDALEAGGASIGANNGTAIHVFTDRINQGKDPGNVPPALREDIEAYQKGLAEHGYRPMPEYCERMVVIPSLKAAGTIDVPIACDRWPLPRIGDTKSAQDIEKSAMKVAVQLGLYSRGAAIWNPKTKRYEPMPKVDQRYGVILGLPALGKRFEARPRVDLATGWRLAQIAYQVHQERKYKGFIGEIATPGQPEPDDDPSAPPAGFSWADQISAATSYTQLSVIFQSAKSEGAWNQALLDLGMEQAKKIKARVLTSN